MLTYTNLTPSHPEPPSLAPVFKKSAKQPEESNNLTSTTRACVCGRLRFLGYERWSRHTSDIIVVLVTNPAESFRPRLRLTDISYVRRLYKRTVDKSQSRKHASLDFSLPSSLESFWSLPLLPQLNYRFPAHITDRPAVSIGQNSPLLLSDLFSYLKKRRFAPAQSDVKLASKHVTCCFRVHVAR